MFDEFDVTDEMDKMHFLQATRIVYYFSIAMEFLIILLLMPQSFLKSGGLVDIRTVYISLIGLMASQRLLLGVGRDYYKYQSGDLKRKPHLITKIAMMGLIMGLSIFAIWTLINWNYTNM